MSTATRAAGFQTSKDLPLLRRTTTVAGKGGQVVIRHLNEEAVLEDEAAHLFAKLRPELSGATDVAAIAAKVSEKPARVRALLEQLEKAGVVAFQSGMEEAPISGIEFCELHPRHCNAWLEDVYLHPLWEKITAGKATRAQVLGFAFEKYHYIEAAFEHMGTAAANATPEMMPHLARH